MSAPAVGATIKLASGAYFDLLEPERNSDARLLCDISHALANVCRFGGHCREFYSVAQHSVLVSRLVRPEAAYAALLHDAAEAFVGDMCAPLKWALPQFKAIEKRIEAWLFQVLRVPSGFEAEIKHADLVALATERRDLLPADGALWTLLEGIEPDAAVIDPLSPVEAWNAFAERLHELLAIHFPEVIDRERSA